MIFCVAYYVTKLSRAPVGVIAWVAGSLQTRFVQRGEPAPTEDAAQFGAATEGLVHEWATERLPYSDRDLSPSDVVWWERVRLLLVWRIQIGPAQQAADMDIETLYRREIILADRFYPSSKTCSRCGWKVAELSLGQRVFRCAQCGLEVDRDYNAAVNLAKLAQEQGESLNAGGGRIGVAVGSRPEKPEPKRSAGSTVAAGVNG